MEEEDGLRDFKQACEQCAEVHWGITDEGKFFCKSCHNVIEKTADGDSVDFMQNVRISSISRGLRKKRKIDHGCEWYICEGFQYILNQQVQALIILGASPQIKDEILCNLWRSYLQKSQQAYVNRPAGSSKRRMVSKVISCSSSLDSPSGSSNFDDRSSFFESKTEDDAASIRSGSVDGSTYRSGTKREKLLMSMPMTLAFCYLALLWLRESITLVDLLRFVAMEHVPYLNTFQHFPTEMVLYGNDAHIFQVQAIPSYDEIQKNMHHLAVFLGLREFPAISEKCFLHPNILIIKYLMEANLPEEMHFWTRQLVKQIGIGETTFLTFQPLIRGTTTIKYEVQAVAVIIIALKLLFGLNDKIEWIASNEAKKISKANPAAKVFQYSKWYQVMRHCLDERKTEAEEETTRHVWKCEKAIFYSSNKKSTIFKKKRVIHSLKKQFSRLAGSHQRAETRRPSSFKFSWSDGNSEKPCFHGDSLEEYKITERKLTRTINKHYWFSSQKICKAWCCKQLTKSEEMNFPESYQFVLRFFSFLLSVDLSTVHKEVCRLEHGLFDVAKLLKPKQKVKRAGRLWVL